MTTAGKTWGLPDRRLDLAGQKFGHLTFLAPISSQGPLGVLWQCLCDCGKECSIYAKNRDAQISCGCRIRASVKPPRKHTQYLSTGDADSGLSDLGRDIGVDESPEKDRWLKLATALEDAAHVARLRAEGLSMDSIAERKGWNVRTLQLWLAAAKKGEGNPVRLLMLFRLKAVRMER